MMRRELSMCRLCFMQTGKGRRYGLGGHEIEIIVSIHSDLLLFEKQVV